jgi:hypothetical protein
MHVGRGGRSGQLSRRLTIQDGNAGRAPSPPPILFSIAMISAPAPSLLALLFVSMASTAPLGCGGGVVVEPTGSGTGGAGGASTTTSSTTTASGSPATTSGTTGAGTDPNPLCADLGKAYEGALAEASQCNACIDADGCIQGMTFTDICGCPVGTDSLQPDKVQKAKDAHTAWANAGCPELACGKACPAGTDWHCQASPDGGCIGACTSP